MRPDHSAEGDICLAEWLAHTDLGVWGSKPGWALCPWPGSYSCFITVKKNLWNLRCFDGTTVNIIMVSRSKGQIPPCWGLFAANGPRLRVTAVTLLTALVMVASLFAHPTKPALILETCLCPNDISTCTVEKWSPCSCLNLLMHFTPFHVFLSFYFIFIAIFHLTSLLQCFPAGGPQCRELCSSASGGVVVGALHAREGGTSPGQSGPVRVSVPTPLPAVCNLVAFPHHILSAMPFNQSACVQLRLCDLVGVLLF